jgi:hypothetical protein
VNVTSTVPVRVEGGGTQVVAHVGLHAVGRFADRLGLADELSLAVAAGGESRLLGHDRGKVLSQVMLMLAGGGECCADIEWLRSQPGLFGLVPSDSTVHRTFNAIDPATLGYLGEAVRDVRAQVWSRSAATTGTAPVVLDLDASLVEIHSENKAGSAASYKGGFGFHPLFCFADATGEALAGLLRPGNATANNIDDQLGVLDAGIAQLPAEVAAGHRPGDGRAAVTRCGSGRTRPGARRGSRRDAGPATSGSVSWPAPTATSAPPSAPSPTTTPAGPSPSTKTASTVTGPQWSR